MGRSVRMLPGSQPPARIPLSWQKTLTMFFLPLSIIDQGQASIVPGYFSEVGEQKQQRLQVQKKQPSLNPSCAVTDCRAEQGANSPGSTWSWGRGRWAPRRRGGPAAPSCGSGLSNSSPWTGRRLLGSSSPLVRRSTLAPRRWSSRRSAGGVRPGGAHSADVSYKEILDSLWSPKSSEWVLTRHLEFIHLSWSTTECSIKSIKI